MKEQIKILYIVSTLKNVGPTNQLYEIVSHLKKDEYQAQILTLSPEPQDSQKECFQNLGIRVESLGMNRIQFIMGGRERLLKKIQSILPDIIHTSGLRADCEIENLKKYRKKHCMTIRNYVFEDYPDIYGKYVGGFFARRHLKSIKNCLYPIACSHSLKKIYADKLNVKMESIQNSVDCKKYERKFFESPSGKKIIFVMSGALIERKNPLTVIKAFCNAELNQKAELMILGDGPLLEQCKILAQNNIIFAGKVQHIEKYLQNADYIISASLSEGLPNSILEAGAAGAGLLLSDIPQHRELVEDLRPSCYDLFPAKRIEQVSELINKYIECAQEIDHKYVGDYFKDKFDSEVMVRHYEELYQKMMKNQL